MANKGSRKITVDNPIFTVVFEDDEELFFKTNSIMKAIEFFQNGEIITMEAIDSRNGAQVTTTPLEKFTISFKTGVWRVATEDAVYKINSK